VHEAVRGAGIDRFVDPLGSFRAWRLVAPIECVQDGRLSFLRRRTSASDSGNTDGFSLSLQPSETPDTRLLIGAKSTTLCQQRVLVRILFSANCMSPFSDEALSLVHARVIRAKRPVGTIHRWTGTDRPWALLSWHGRYGPGLHFEYLHRVMGTWIVV
jgi:hypothetical protein